MSEIQWENSKITIEKILDPNPNLHLKNAEIALKDGRYENALEEIEYAYMLANGNYEVVKQCQKVEDVLYKIGYLEEECNNCIDDIIRRADKGNRESQYVLGICYGTGQKVELDYYKAVKYLKMAANQSHKKALAIYAFLLYKGEGVKANKKEAKDILEKLVTEGESLAYEYLGMIYAVGEGNYKKGISFLKRIVDDGRAEIANTVGVYYQLLGEFNESNKYYKIANEKDKTVANVGLGMCYSLGWGVEKDINKAKSYFETSIINHYEDEGDACAMLAAIYQNSGGIFIKKKKIFELWNRALELGCIAAYSGMALCYIAGYGVRKDYKKAFWYFQQGYEKGDKSCQEKLAECYFRGIGCEKNVQKGNALLEELY